MIRILALLGIAVLLGCSSPLESCEGTTPVAGSWRYEGAQESPMHASLAGALVLEGDGCGTLTGQLDVVENDGLGHTRRIAGPVTGRVVDATSIRFDALIDGIARQHIARIEAGNLSGTWLALSGDASQALTGTFGGRREASQ